MQDDQAAIEEFTDVHGQPRVGTAAAQLDPAGAEADGVVARHHAPIATAEDEGELAGRPTPDGVRGGGPLAKPAIEIGDELGQVRLGGVDRGDLAHAEFADEPVLQRGP